MLIYLEPSSPSSKLKIHVSFQETKSNGLQIKYSLNFPTCLFPRTGSLPWSWDSFPPPVTRTMALNVPNRRFSFKFLNCNFCPQSVFLSIDFHLADRHHLGITCRRQTTEFWACWKLMWTSPINGLVFPSLQMGQLTRCLRWTPKAPVFESSCALMMRPRSSLQQEVVTGESILSPPLPLQQTEKLGQKETPRHRGKNGYL